jgi:DNA repair protein RecO (recombination protein O)
LEQLRPLREDLHRYGRATAMLEAVDQLGQERHANPRLYQMLLGALRALAAHDAPLLVPAFFLKALALEGFHPRLDECAACGSDGPLVAFDLVQGGALCRACGRGLHVGTQTLDLVRQILGGELATALGHPADGVADEVDRLATRALEQHLERRLRSLSVL